MHEPSDNAARKAARVAAITRGEGLAQQQQAAMTVSEMAGRTLHTFPLPVLRTVRVPAAWHIES
mgnify:CR=1 FL=1